MGHPDDVVASLILNTILSKLDSSNWKHFLAIWDPLISMEHLEPDSPNGSAISHIWAPVALAKLIDLLPSAQNNLSAEKGHWPYVFLWFPKTFIFEVKWLLTLIPLPWLPPGHSLSIPRPPPHRAGTPCHPRSMREACWVINSVHLQN